MFQKSQFLDVFGWGAPSEQRLRRLLKFERIRLFALRLQRAEQLLMFFARRLQLQISALVLGGGHKRIDLGEKARRWISTAVKLKG